MSQQNKYHRLNDIDQLTQKRIQLIKEQLAPQLAQIFGYHALLYSNVSKVVCDDASCIQRQFVIDTHGKDLSLICHFEELPIASDCIDLAVLPAILQQSDNPHQILREVERVLIPEGIVIVIGRNPISWLGVRQKLKQWRVSRQSHDNNDEKIELSRDISRGRIADWFNLLGLKPETTINISVTNDKIQKHSSYLWIKQLSQLFCDCFCSYYIIIARKKVSTLTPIRPSWRRNKQLVPPRLAEPSVKTQVQSWFDRWKL